MEIFQENLNNCKNKINIRIAVTHSLLMKIQAINLRMLVQEKQRISNNKLHNRHSKLIVISINWPIIVDSSAFRKRTQTIFNLEMKPLNQRGITELATKIIVESQLNLLRMEDCRFLRMVLKKNIPC